jgi:hypothetical protein
MNQRIQELAEQAGMEDYPTEGVNALYGDVTIQKFAELIVEAVLDQVEQRAYYTGDRDWSDELDRPWIQLEFGYGALHDAKTKGVKQ